MDLRDMTFAIRDVFNGVLVRREVTNELMATLERGFSCRAIKTVLKSAKLPVEGEAPCTVPLTSLLLSSPFTQGMS
jgi:hypothetical protein